jgi:hypothetical protein
MKVALCKIQEFRMAGKKTPLNEPSGLVGMHNQLLRNGTASIIVDNALQPWQEAVRRFSPDVVGITSPHKALSGETAEFMRELRKTGVTTVLGGIFSTINPKYFAEAFNPSIIVLGQGEPVMDELIKHSFVVQQAKASPMYRGNIGRTALFKSDRFMPLDQITFRRPYFLGAYDKFAWPSTVYGCVHECSFCVSDGSITFRSPESALGEMLYLKRVLGADAFFPIGGDFTASPPQANEIVRGIVSNPELLDAGYDLNVRIDSLHSAIRLDPKAWKKFLSRTNGVVFMPGLESFVPERLVRLGKYRKLDAAQKHEKMFVDIMDFFKGTRAVMMPNFIMFDPESSPGEIERDLAAIEGYLSRYKGQFSIADGEVFNYLKPVDGSKANSLYHANGDDFYDPVVRHPLNFALLLYFIYARPRATYELESNKDVEEHARVTLKHIGFLRDTMDRLLTCFKGGGKQLSGLVKEIINEQFPARSGGQT